jgi:hypothetical protein
LLEVVARLFGGGTLMIKDYTKTENSNLIDRITLILASLLIVACLFVMHSNSAFAASKSEILERVLENCDFDDGWKTNIAINGYVYGDYVYFTRNEETKYQNIYRINIKDYKLKKYVKNVFHNAVFQDNYVFYETFYTDNPKQGVYAKNLDTGKVMKLRKDSDTWIQYTKKFKDKIYWIKDVYDKKSLYSINTDGTEKKKICSKIYDGNYAFFSNESTEKLVYIRLYDQYASKYFKIYSANPDGSDWKLIKKVKNGGSWPQVGLREQDGEVILTVTDYNREEREYTHELFIFDGKKFNKLGSADEYPEYAGYTLEDGYRYKQIISNNLDYLENGRGLLITRQETDGKWKEFSHLSYVNALLGGKLEMHNGYLMNFGYDGDDPSYVSVLDKNGDLLCHRHIAGLTDYTNMHATVIGNKLYIIHGAVYVDDNGAELDKHEIIDLDELRDFYAKNGNITLKEIQDKFVKTMKTEGYSYKPGSDEFSRYLDGKIREIVKNPSSGIKKDEYLLELYGMVYYGFYNEYINILTDFEDEKIDIDAILANNDCIVFDEKTGEYSFEISETFLNIKISDIVKNKVK